jgi:aminoglycoside phosphotransferase
VRPKDEPEIPEAVRAIAAGRDIRAVWRNELGGLTFEVGRRAGGAAGGHVFVKWAPAGSDLPLPREAERLAWAGRFTPVPRVVGSGRDEAGTWLVTAALAGGNAVEARWRADPARAVAAIGHGLRRLHDALPVDACPFTWAATDRVEVSRRLAAEDRYDPASWHPDHAGLTVETAMARLGDPPEPDRLVVCHGDACAPNTLLDDAGTWVGHVDMAALGVADRWADLAIATWSLGWNYGPGWEPMLLRSYGIAPDPQRTAYYRLLWQLGP